MTIELNKPGVFLSRRVARCRGRFVEAACTALDVWEKVKTHAVPRRHPVRGSGGYVQHIGRVGHNCTHTPCMAVYLVISLQKIPYTHRIYIYIYIYLFIYMVMAKPTYRVLQLARVSEGEG